MGGVGRVAVGVNVFVGRGVHVLLGVLVGRGVFVTVGVLVGVPFVSVIFGVWVYSLDVGLPALFTGDRVTGIVDVGSKV